MRLRSYSGIIFAFSRSFPLWVHSLEARTCLAHIDRCLHLGIPIMFAFAFGVIVGAVAFWLYGDKVLAKLDLWFKQEGR